MDIKEKIHNASQKGYVIEEKIRLFTRILESKDNKNFCNHADLKVSVDDKQENVLDGGFTNLNYVEISLTKEEVLELAEFALESYKNKQNLLVKSLSDDFKQYDKH